MTPRAHVIIAATLLGAVVGFLLAGTTDDTKADSAYLSYAKGFAPYTAKVRAQVGDESWESTATAVSDRWLLTAAHVTGESATASVTLSGRTIPIDRIVRHPEYQAGVVGRNDLALLHAAEPLGLDYYPALSDGDEAAGDICSIAGYGVHGSMSVGHDRADGRLRAGTNHIEEFDGSMIHCTASPGASPLEICIAPGDSGGPLFCRGKLAGVNSLTFADRPKPKSGEKPKPPASRAGEKSAHVRVAAYRAWIDGVIGDDKEAKQ